MRASGSLLGPPPPSGHSPPPKYRRTLGKIVTLDVGRLIRPTYTEHIVRSFYQGEDEQPVTQRSCKTEGLFPVIPREMQQRRGFPCGFGKSFPALCDTFCDTSRCRQDRSALGPGDRDRRLETGAGAGGKCFMGDVGASTIRPARHRKPPAPLPST
jgi:hypothetical protein